MWGFYLSNLQLVLVSTKLVLISTKYVIDELFARPA
jgi:hypothetical protein